MKNLIIASILAVVLVGCSTEQTPTPQKLSQDIKSLPPSTVMWVISKDDYPVPKGAQIIERTGTYETIDNIYDERGYNILIPRNAIIKGTYTNDGRKCTITWNSIYINKAEYNKNAGSREFHEQAVPTVCDPIKGIKKGSQVLIHLNKALIFEPL